MTANGRAWWRVAPWLFALVAAACGHSTERERVDFERMRRQQRVNAYGSAATFANGMAMRAPPAGTLSREDFVLGDSVVGGKQRGAYVSRIPLSVTRELMARGAHDFQTYCVVCHGDEPGTLGVVGMNLRPPPPSLVGDSARKLLPGEMFEIISLGRGRMPGYRWALPAVERWGIIAYLRSREETRR